MKPLRPSMRENKRYLLLRGKDFPDSESVILEFIGTLGMSKAGLNWIERRNDYAIVSINREMMDEVRAGFSASKKDIQVAKVSGTLKGLKN